MRKRDIFYFDEKNHFGPKRMYGPKNISSSRWTDLVYLFFWIELKANKQTNIQSYFAKQTFDALQLQLPAYYSVTRLGNILHFGQLFKACGINYFAQIAHILVNFCKVVEIFHFCSEIIFGQLYRNLATFYFSHCCLSTLWPKINKTLLCSWHTSRFTDHAVSCKAFPS